MTNDEIVYRIMYDLDQVEQRFQNDATPPEIVVLMTYHLIERLQAGYHGFILSMKDGMTPTFCGHPIRKCSGDGMEYFISAAHGIIKETADDNS